MKKIGTRVFPSPLDDRMGFPPGGYGKDENGKWMVRPPGESLGDLNGHSVEEHDDLTITIRPSIVGESGIHYYLSGGVWEWQE